MGKLLYISNIAGKRMSYNFVGSAIEAAQSLNIDFYSAMNRSASTEEDIRLDEEKYGIKLLHIDLSRSPFSLQNYKAYKQLVKIIRDENIDYIHCNTPVGGMLGRLAGKKCKIKRVIYQAHGFHFYKGAPKKNWLIYYPVEKWLARYTDALITINGEDFELAKAEMKLRGNGKVYYIHGVGIDTDFYTPDGEINKDLRKELGFSDNDFAVISVGRLEPNKNTETLIKALAAIKDENVKLIVCGDGVQREYLEKLSVELGLENQVIFLGNVADMKNAYRAADVLASASFREGLSRTVMEAMASGLPCVISNIRGNTDLIEDGKGGFLCETEDASAYAEKIKLLAEDKSLREKMGRNNLITIQKFSTETVTEEIRRIYKSEFGGE